MKGKMQIYAEILRQLARMPDKYEEPDMSAMDSESEDEMSKEDTEKDKKEYEDAE